jgi:hypothetical protein
LAFPSKYFRRRRLLRQSPWFGSDAACFSSSAYRTIRMAVMNAWQPCS